MTAVTRRVEQTYAAAKGQAVAHLDPATLDELALDRGDTVSLEGNNRTAVTVERLRERDWDDGIVRTDEFTRHNSGIRPGQTLSVEPVDPVAAHYVVSPAHGGAVDESNLVTLCEDCHAAAHEYVTTPSV
jgi:5-methylcytosine-specific restriction endonuclease McrA